MCVFVYMLEQYWEKDKGGENKRNQESEIVEGRQSELGQKDRGEKERVRQEDGTGEACSNKTDGGWRVCSYRLVHVHWRNM